MAAACRNSPVNRGRVRSPTHRHRVHRHRRVSRTVGLCPRRSINRYDLRVKKPPHAWHYTTARGLINILSTHRIWASSAAYMNDRDEIRAGRKALNLAIERHNPPLQDWQLSQLRRFGVTKDGRPDEVFLLCASILGDALTLWRSYGVGGEAEYSIDLDPNVRLWPIEQDDAENHPAPPPGWYEQTNEIDESGQPRLSYDADVAYSFGGGWQKVEYLRKTSQAAERELQRVLGDVVQGSRDAKLAVWVLDYVGGPNPTVFFKHPGFRDEREVRAAWTVQPWWRFVKYREARFGVTPFIEVGTSTSRHSDDDFTRKPFVERGDLGRLPIRTIRIGPTRAADAAERSLRELLDVHGYGHVAIVQSSTPYR
jgi:hypothetical protein